MYTFRFRRTVFRFVPHRVEHDTRHPGFFLFAFSSTVGFLQALNGLSFFFLGLAKRLFLAVQVLDRKSTRLNSSHVRISYAVFCLKKKLRCRGSDLRRALACTALRAACVRPSDHVAHQRTRVSQSGRCGRAATTRQQRRIGVLADLAQRAHALLSLLERAGGVGFFCSEASTTENYTLSLHDALPI